jgi:hypothetical protein
MIRWYSKVKIVIRYCITAQVLVYVLRRLALNTLNIIPLPSCVIYSRIISPKEIQGPCSILYERSSRGSRIEDRSNPMRKCLLPSPSPPPPSLQRSEPEPAPAHTPASSFAACSHGDPSPDAKSIGPSSETPFRLRPQWSLEHLNLGCLCSSWCRV